jgi:hypothetical protein
MMTTQERINYLNREYAKAYMIITNRIKADDLEKQEAYTTLSLYKWEYRSLTKDDREPIKIAKEMAKKYYKDRAKKNNRLMVSDLQKMVKKG